MKLRVGLLLDSLHVPAWVYATIERIQQSDYAEISLIVLNASETPRVGPIRRLVRSRRFLTWSAYTKLEAMICRLEPDAFTPKDITDLTPNVPVLRVKPVREASSDSFEDGDVDEIRGHGLDVLFQKGFGSLKGRILDAARHGVWSYHHGDNRVMRGEPEGFWEVFESSPVTGSVLRALAEDPNAGVTLYRSYASTDDLFVHRNLNGVCWKSVSFLPRVLRELSAIGHDAFVRKMEAEKRKVSFCCHPLHERPTNLRMLGQALRHVAGYAKRKALHAFYRDQWILLYDLAPGLSTSLRGYTKILPPKDRFWADPFVVERDGTYYIFIEEFPYARNKGHIALLTMDGNGNCTPPETIIDKPYHLSYPFVFEWNGEWYMIPESVRNRTIELYKCVEFPNEWVWQKNLMEGIRAVDTTLLNHLGKWWLFVGICENQGASTCDELFLYYADTPTTDEWTPHPKNPIVSDVRRARPAGRIFERDDCLCRPSQDCSGTYGGAMQVNRITRLTETEYEESRIASLTPDWDRKLLALHTLQHEGNLTIIDGVLRRRKFF